MFDRVYTVTLPTGMPVSFPDECVGCGHRFPGHAAQLLTRDARHGLALWAGWLGLRVPACRGCARRLHLWRWWSFSRTLLIAAGGIAFGITVLLPRLPGAATGLIVLSLIIVAYLACFLIDRRFPPAFNVDLRGGLTDYEFRNPSQAAAFAGLNGAVPDPTA
jgi:hypothetical protein